MKRHISILLSFLLLFLFSISFALTEKDFKHSMNFYQKLVEKKVSVEELIFTLEKILKRYSDIEVNLTPIREKLLILRKFKISRDFYRKLEAKGASLDERITALKRIIIKFRNTDVDLSGMEKKLKQLQEGKTEEWEEIEEIGEFKVEEGTGTPEVEKDLEEFELEGEKKEEFEQEEMSTSEIKEEIEKVEEVKDLEEFEDFKP